MDTDHPGEQMAALMSNFNPSSRKQSRQLVSKPLRKSGMDKASPNHDECVNILTHHVNYLPDQHTGVSSNALECWFAVGIQPPCNTFPLVIGRECSQMPQLTTDHSDYPLLKSLLGYFPAQVRVWQASPDLRYPRTSTDCSLWNAPKSFAWGCEPASSLTQRGLLKLWVTVWTLPYLVTSAFWSMKSLHPLFSLSLGQMTRFQGGN